MKKLLCIIIFINLVQISFGQEGTLKLGVYKWNTIIPMEACNIDGNPNVPSLKLPNRLGQLFNFVKRKGSDTAIIQILNYADTSTSYFLYNKSFNKEAYVKMMNTRDNAQKTLIDAQLYFLVPISSISEGAQPVFARNWQFTVGALTMPVKMRIQKEFDFSGSFNISAAGGAKLRISKYNENYMDLLISIGLSSVNIDSFSRKNSDVKLLPTANLSALTIGTGIVFEFGKAQVGLMFGWDYLSARDQKNYQWKYNGKPWFAIGFGLAIFGKQEEKADPSEVSNGGKKD